MKKDEELRMILREVMRSFDKEDYEKSLLSIEAAGSLIIKKLNTYNKKK